MKKDTLRSFSLDSNIVNSTAVARLRRALGAEGFGVYIMLLCRLRTENGCVAERDYESIAYALAVESDLVRRVVEEFGLFELTEEGFYSCEIHRQRKIELPANEPVTPGQEQTTPMSLDLNLAAINSDSDTIHTLSKHYGFTPNELRQLLFSDFREECRANASPDETLGDIRSRLDDWLNERNQSSRSQSSCS